MYAPTGGTGFEKAPDGVYVGYCHGLFYLGTHTNKFHPDDPPRDKGMFVIELDHRDSKGTRITTFTREGWSVNKLSNIRTKVAPALVEESFGWSDDDWSQQDLEALFAGRACLVNIQNGYPKGFRPLGPGQTPIQPERGGDEWAETKGIHPVVYKERHGVSATRQGTFEDAAARFQAPIPLRPGPVKTKASDEAEALAKEVGGAALPPFSTGVTDPGDDWDDANPKF